MERCSLLNGSIANQDADYSAPLLALTDGGVIAGLQVTHLSGSSFEVSIGSGLIACTKSNGDRVLVHFQNTAIKSLSFAGPKKVWIEIYQANLDNPLLNPSTGLGIGQINFGTSYPVANFIPLASIDGANVVTDARILIKTIDDAMANAISQIQSGATSFSATSTGPTNTYNITYPTEIVASISGNPASIPQGILYFFKAHQDNTGNIVASVNTTEGVLTAPVKKMHDQDLSAGDIETNQRVALQRDGINFQMQSQVAQVPVGSIQNSTVLQIAGEPVKAGQPGFAGRGIIDKLIIKQSNGGGAYKIGDGTSIRLQFQFLTGIDNILRNVRVQIRKVGSPSDNVECRIMEIDRTTVVATSSTVIAGGSFSGNFLECAFVFNDVVLNPNQRYIIDIRRSGSNSAINHYEVEGNGTNSYAYGQLHYFDGTNWLLYGGNVRFAIQMGFNHELGKWRLSDNDFESTSQVDGFFAQTKLAGRQVEITVGGVNTNQIGLSSGQEYFLSNQIEGSSSPIRDTHTQFGYSSTSQEKIAQSFMLNRSLTIDRILLSIWKQGSPTDNVIIRIETDNADSPSGTLVHANAQCTVNYTNLSTGSYNSVFQFLGSFILAGAIKYRIVLSRSGALDTTNYYRTKVKSSNIFEYGNMELYQNSARTANARDMFFDLLQQYNGLEQNSLNTETYLGYSTADRQKQAQKVVIDSDQTIKQICLSLRKDGSPTDAVKVRIETDSASGPSGTLVHANAELTLSATSLTTSLLTYFLSFPGSFTLLKNTVYWIVVERTGSLSTSNFYRIGIHNGSLYHYGHTKRLISSVWTDNADTEDFFFNFVTLYKKQPGNIGILSRFNYFYKVGKAIDETKISLDFDDTYIVSSNATYREFRNVGLTETITADLGGGGVKTYYFGPRKFISIGFNGYITIRAEGNRTDFGAGGVDTQSFDYFEFGNRRAVRANSYASFALWSDGYGWNSRFCTLNGVIVSPDNLRVKKGDILGIGFTMYGYRNSTAPAITSYSAQLNAILIKASLVKNASLLVS